MDRFKTRIKYYVVGLLLGLVFTYLFFGNRGCAWLPENRVKNMIAEKEIFVGDSVKFLMDCAGIDQNDVYNLLNEEGDIEFSKSKTHEYPKIYWFRGMHGDQELDIQYALYDSTAEVVGFHLQGQTKCQTTLSNRNKSVVPLPDNEVVEIIEAKPFRTMDKAKCQMTCLGIKEDEAFAFHVNAKYDHSLSEPRKTPNAVYAMSGSINGKNYTFIYVSGDSRTRIREIISEKECNCAD